MYTGSQPGRRNGHPGSNGVAMSNGATGNNPKFAIQDSEYEFPYHHLADLQRRTSRRAWIWGPLYAMYMRRVIDLVSSYRPHSLLDVGCGDGKLIFELLRRPIRPGRLLGIDLSERAIAFARAFCPDADFRCEDVANLSEQFEVITLVQTLEHIPDDAVPGFTAAVAQRLTHGGKLIVSVPSISAPLPEKHYRHYTIESCIASFPTLRCVAWQRFFIRGRLAGHLCAWRQCLEGVRTAGQLLWRLIDRASDVDHPEGQQIICVFSN